MKKIITLLLLLVTNIIYAQKAVRPWIGVHIDTGSEGVLIKKAVNDTPASRAGLVAGDQILSVDGHKVTAPIELIQLVGKKGVGHTVSLKYLSANNKTIKTTLKLEAMPGMTDLVKKNLLNKTAPSFKTKILSKSKEKTYSIGEHPNKVKILEFWATWCGACMQAHPLIHEFAKKNKDLVTVLSISNEDPKVIKKFINKAQKHKAISKSVIYLQGKDTKIGEKYFVPALPTFLVIDKKNIVRHITIGVGEELLKTFEKALELAKEK